MTWFTIEFLVRFISCPDRSDITTTDVGFALNFAEKEIEGIWKIHFLLQTLDLEENYITFC